MHEYGRTSSEGLYRVRLRSRDVEITKLWQGSAHYQMLQTGELLLRRRLNAATEGEFSLLPNWRAAG